MALNESFGNLVDDITKQILEQVQSQVQGSISDVITRRINELLTPEVINTIITSQVTQQITNFQPDLTQFEQRIIEAGDRIINTINTDSTNKINELIVNKINGINLEELARTFLDNNLNSTGKHLALVDNAIPGRAINTATLKITGDNIDGGTVANFASTGIDDKATTCQLTIMDAGTVFENTLYAPRVEIKGNALIDGDLIITGEIPKSSQTYQNIIADVSTIAEATHDRILTRLQTESLDVARLTLGQVPVIEGNTLSGVILNSRLQTVGQLKDLQTQGETLLSETLYTSNRRVGVNTMDPTTALSIWDEEIEIGIGKQSSNTAQLGTPREQSLVLSSNKQKNITLTADGTAVIPKLQIGNMAFSSAATPPSYNAPKGTVVFNENPSLGGPLGWVSLGDARWANFGIID